MKFIIFKGMIVNVDSIACISLDDNEIILYLSKSFIGHPVAKKEINSIESLSEVFDSQYDVDERMKELSDILVFERGYHNDR